MIINSTLVFCLVPELEAAFEGTRIIQILQSSDRKELLLRTRSKKKQASLFFSGHAENCRIEILDEEESEPKRSNCEKTNLFSYAIGGYIQEVKQADFDRVIQISCVRKSQLGTSIEFDLVFELTGRNANLILVRNDGLVIDCLRKIDSTQSRFRQVLPGERYFPPPSPKKENPFAIEKEKFVKLLKDHDLSVSGLLTSHFAGLDQLLAEEILFETNIPLSVRTKDLNEDDIEPLWNNFRRTFEKISEQKLTFQIIKDHKGKPEAISCMDIGFLEDDRKIFCESVNSAIKKFFSQKIEEEQNESDLRKFSEVAHRAQKRLGKRKEKIEQDLDKAQKFDQYKKFGDLVMMNKDLIRKGRSSVKLVDIFEPRQTSVEIPLSTGLSAIQNAQAYFKKYKKGKDALVVMGKRKAETEKESVQLEQILNKLKKATEETGLEEIEKKLISLGLLKDEKAPEKRKKVKREFSPRKFTAKDGSEILVGRNNRENDYLTFKLAQPNDLWFHAQDVPGSHVVLRRKEKKREPSTNDIRQAARAAAYFSKARGSKRVPVIYTQAKYVRKPKKGKPGVALVEREKTILVEPKLTDN